jgi:hypothetical protein
MVSASASSRPQKSSMSPLSFERRRFPDEVIRHAVWLYFRFTLSFRNVEELLVQRGIEVRPNLPRKRGLRLDQGGSLSGSLRAERSSARWRFGRQP